MPLAVAADRASALCLTCYVPLRRAPTGFALSSSSAGDGGDGGIPVARPVGDAELFCSGTCRATYVGRRNTAALRRQLASLDGAICAACGLDAAALSQALSEAPPGAPRAALLARLAPCIAAEAGLAARVLEAPHLAGNAWHADHRVAVADGGGECTVQNMQVLCVACHLAKTRREAADRRQRGAGMSTSPSPASSGPRRSRSRSPRAAKAVDEDGAAEARGVGRRRVDLSDGAVKGVAQSSSSNGRGKRTEVRSTFFAGAGPADAS